jgi:hypothetical protein
MSGDRTECMLICMYRKCAGQSRSTLEVLVLVGNSFPLKPNKHKSDTKEARMAARLEEWRSILWLCLRSLSKNRPNGGCFLYRICSAATEMDATAMREPVAAREQWQKGGECDGARVLRRAVPFLVEGDEENAEG